MVVPLLAALAWCVEQRSPLHDRQVQSGLSAAVGLPAKVDKTSSPRPGVTKFVGLALGSPEAGATIRSPSVEVSESADSIVINAPQAELDGGALAALWTAAQQQIRRGALDKSVQLAPCLLSLTIGEHRQRLAVSSAKLAPTAIGHYALVRFRTALGAPAEDAMLEIWFDRRSRPAQVSFRLQTGKSSVPTELLAPLWPAALHLGAQCQFQGTLWAQRTTGGWAGEMSGRLADLDLEVLLARQFDVPISGAATVDIQLAEFRDSALARLWGTLEATSGRVSGAILADSAVRLGCPGAKIDAEAEVVYDRLQFVFGVEQGRFQLQPAAAGAPTLTAGGQTLIGPPTGKVQPLEELVRVLGPRDAQLVPASPRLAQLVALLPLAANRQVETTAQRPE